MPPAARRSVPEADEAAEASNASDGAVTGSDETLEVAEAKGTDGLSDWERKRRLAEIFGDVLPSTTRDERGPGAGESGESANDAWLRRQVPPHHGG